MKKLKQKKVFAGGKYYPMEEAMLVYKEVSKLFGSMGGRPKS